MFKNLIKTPRIYKKRDKDLYIDILRWAVKQETFTIKRLIKDLDITSIYLKSWINKEVERESLFIKVGKRKFRGGHMLDIYKLSMKARFQLLEVEELELARKNAQEARTWAIRAIMVALLTLVIIMFLSIVEFLI